MIKNTHGLYVVKSIELGEVVIQSEHSRFRVFFDYDFGVIDQAVKFFVNVKEIHILINDDYSIFIELSKFDKGILKSLALVIIEHMEQQ